MNKNQIRVNKSEYEVIKEVAEFKQELFESRKINDSEYIISFNELDSAEELDELIKDQLIYKGFDIDYNPNNFGLNCENLIDKLYEILK